MTKGILALTVAVAFSLPAVAQDQKPKPGPGGGEGRPRMTPEERVKMMKERLNLNDDQTGKVKAILERNQEKFKALREDTSSSQEDKRAKFGEIFKASNDEILAVLTPEQQTKFKEEMAKRRAGAGRPGGPRPGGGPQGGAGKPGADKAAPEKKP